MKNFKDSDYAINKFSKSIVYRFANQIKEVTLEDFLSDSPSHTPEQFEQLKKISDEIYLQQVTDENAQTAKNTPLTDNIATESPEKLLIASFDIEQRRNEARIKLRIVFSCLTKVQYRRLILHEVKGLTTREIAAKEGVSHQSVVECLSSAKKKIKNKLRKS